MQSCKKILFGGSSIFLSSSLSLSLCHLQRFVCIPPSIDGGYFSWTEMFLTCILPPSDRSLLLSHIDVLPLYTIGEPLERMIEICRGQKCGTVNSTGRRYTRYAIRGEARCENINIRDRGGSSTCPIHL